MKRIFIGSDHAGFHLKKMILEKLKENRENLSVLDIGAYSTQPVPTALIAKKGVFQIQNGIADWGILICGTGGGMCIAANRFPGIRAVLCIDHFTAEYARRHNNANICILGSRIIEPEIALQIVDIFRETSFDGGKYQERLNYLEEVENDLWLTYLKKQQPK
jgi:ribose 5-phosphate isomerase B